jgi:predicted small secreted protein
MGCRPVSSSSPSAETAMVRQHMLMVRSSIVTTIVERMLIMMKKLMLVLVALTLGSPVLLTGCNTMQGAGRDIEKAGNKIQDEAAEHKHY